MANVGSKPITRKTSKTRNQNNRSLDFSLRNKKGTIFTPAYEHFHRLSINPSGSDNMNYQKIATLRNSAYQIEQKIALPKLPKARKILKGLELMDTANLYSVDLYKNRDNRQFLSPLSNPQT